MALSVEKCLSFRGFASKTSDRVSHLLPIPFVSRFWQAPALLLKSAMRRLFCTVGILLALHGVATSQTLPGVQMFSTNEYGVDVATGNVNIGIPLRSKTGKIPFWSKLVGTSGMTIQNFVWQPMFPSGQYYQDPGSASFSTNNNASIFCGQNQQGTIKYYYYEMDLAWVTDSTGGAHEIPGVWYATNAPAGTQGCALSNYGPFTASDGSGYTLIVTNGIPTVYNKAGDFTVGSCGGSTCSFGIAPGITDPDEASIGHGGVVTDSLNTTVYSSYSLWMLVPLSYTDVNGNTQSYTAGFTTPNVATNFNCTNYQGAKYPGDRPASPVRLLTSLTLPDGAQYGFSYEATTGGNYTGRISGITFPTGGSVSYNYNSGINCNYDTVPEVDVTVADGSGHTGIYTYVSSLTTTPVYDPYLTNTNFTVTKTDKQQGNQTVFTFTGEYQTQAQYYQSTV